MFFVKQKTGRTALHIVEVGLFPPQGPYEIRRIPFQEWEASSFPIKPIGKLPFQVNFARNHLNII